MKATVFFIGSILLAPLSQGHEPQPDTLRSSQALNELHQNLTSKFLHADVNETDSLQHYLILKKDAEEKGHTQDLARTTYKLAKIYEENGESLKSISTYYDLLEIGEKINDNSWQGAARLNLAQIFMRAGEFQNALAYLRQAYADYGMVNSPVNQSMVLYEMARQYLKRQLPDSAKPYLNQALRLIPSDRTSHISKIYNNLGAVAFWEQRYALARYYYLTALKFVSNNSKRKYSIAYNNVGEAYFAEGRKQEATQWLEQALALKRQINNKPTSNLITITLLAKIHSEQGDITGALELLNEGLLAVNKDDVSAATMDALDLAAQLAATHPEIPVNNYLIALNDRVSTLRDNQETLAELSSRYDLQQHLSKREQAKLNEMFTYWGTIAILFIALIAATLLWIYKVYRDYKKEVKEYIRVNILKNAKTNVKLEVIMAEWQLFIAKNRGQNGY